MAPFVDVTRARQPRSQFLWLCLLLALMIGLTAGLMVFGWRQSALFLIGTLFGLTLYQASFGFASAYRRLVVHGDGQGVLAQVLMLALATVLFAPILISGVGRGALAPVAVQGAIGALLFGVGMQLGSGCACGTLYTIGGGSSMMVLTLLTFGTGSFLGTLTNGFWQGLPKTEAVSLIGLWGWGGAALQLGLLGLLGLGLWRWQTHFFGVPLGLIQPAIAPLRSLVVSGGRHCPGAAEYLHPAAGRSALGGDLGVHPLERQAGYPTGLEPGHQ